MIWWWMKMQKCVEEDLRSCLPQEGSFYEEMKKSHWQELYVME